MIGKEMGSGVQLSRRDMIRRLLGGAGSTMFLAQTAMAHPIGKYLADGALLAGADTQVAGERWTPKVLNPQQNSTLIVVAEQILPNSGKALVNRFIDLLLSVDTAETRDRFNASLSAFDQESTRRFGKPFQEISGDNQLELLTAMSGKNPQEGGSVAPVSARLLSGHGENGPSMHDHFQNIKTWVVGAYYSSETGMRELGWTGIDFYPDFPGCRHAGSHA